MLALRGVLLLPGLASAHIVPETTHGFREGLAHPFTGLDHLLAMFAVGLWAAQHRGRAVWMIPLTFVGVMGLGGALGLAGAAMPGGQLAVEIGIAMSVLVFGRPDRPRGAIQTELEHGAGGPLRLVSRVCPRPRDARGDERVFLQPRVPWAPRSCCMD